MKKTLVIALLATFCFIFLVSCYIPRSGLYENAGGIRYYVNDIYQTGWQEIEGDKYYFSSVDGYMKTSPCSIAGEWFGFASDGKLLNGFSNEDVGVRYYINGKYQVLWQEIDDERYYFYKENGVMATGSVKIGGIDYVFSDKGCLIDNED